MVDKVRENRARRAVARRGYELQKTRRRDPQAFDYQTYQVVDAISGKLILGDKRRGFGLSLADVEAWLRGEDK